MEWIRTNTAIRKAKPSKQRSLGHGWDRDYNLQQSFVMGTVSWWGLVHKTHHHVVPAALSCWRTSWPSNWTTYTGPMFSFICKQITAARSWSIRLLLDFLQHKWHYIESEELNFPTCRLVIPMKMWMPISHWQHPSSIGIQNCGALTISKGAWRLCCKTSLFGPMNRNDQWLSLTNFVIGFSTKISIILNRIPLGYSSY